MANAARRRRPLTAGWRVTGFGHLNKLLSPGTARGPRPSLRVPVSGVLRVERRGMPRPVAVWVSTRLCIRVSASGYLWEARAKAFVGAFVGLGVTYNARRLCSIVFGSQVCMFRCARQRAVCVAGQVWTYGPSVCDTRRVAWVDCAAVSSLVLVTPCRADKVSSYCKCVCGACGGAICRSARSSQRSACGNGRFAIRGPSAGRGACAGAGSRRSCPLG